MDGLSQQMFNNKNIRSRLSSGKFPEPINSIKATKSPAENHANKINTVASCSQSLVQNQTKVDSVTTKRSQLKPKVVARVP